MKKMGFAAITAAVLVVGLAGCGSDDNGGASATTAETTSAVVGAMAMVDTPQCEEFCARVDKIAADQCEAGGSGAACADVLTPQAMLAMKIRDSDSADPDVKEVASELVDNGSEFSSQGCNKQDPMDLTCGVLATTIYGQMTTLQLKLHTP